jgi:nucleoside 2-deoxyribosyltransferase
MQKQKEPHVFVSATSKDAPLVRVLSAKLRAAGLEPWIANERIKSKHDVAAATVDAIRSCDALVVLLTPQSIHLANVSFEAGAAIMSGKPLIPVLAGVDAGELPAPLRSFSAVPFDRFDDAVRRLERTLAVPA